MTQCISVLALVQMNIHVLTVHIYFILGISLRLYNLNPHENFQIIETFHAASSVINIVVSTYFSHNLSCSMNA